MKHDASEADLGLDQLNQRQRCANGHYEERLANSPGRQRSGSNSTSDRNRDPWSALPMTVKEAAQFLGVSPQTVYLWVERKQIPHFRVMGRNIRFLKSDLKPFRAQFKHEVENGKTA